MVVAVWAGMVVAVLGEGVVGWTEVIGGGVGGGNGKIGGRLGGVNGNIITGT